MINKIGKSFLTMFGIGYFPKFPGTIASLTTCLIFYILWFFFGFKIIIIPSIFFLILIFFFSIFLINKIYKDKDSEEIVIDELIGQFIPLLAWYNSEINASKLFVMFGLELYAIETWIILSFILFRIFDILKPYPINLIDKNIKNGFGVIFDDVVAGVFATIVLYIIFV